MRHNQPIPIPRQAMNTRAQTRLQQDGTSRAPALPPAQAEAQLRAAAVRVTAARIKVLAALLDAPSAVSHQDVQARLSELDRVTLYRALDCLTDSGLAHKIAGDDRIFRYSAGTEHGARDWPHAQHPHGHSSAPAAPACFAWTIRQRPAAPQPGLSLRKAGAQAALQRQLQDVVRQTLGDGFQSHDIELTIKGWCADCAQ